jgi:hypothetical protein
MVRSVIDQFRSDTKNVMMPRAKTPLTQILPAWNETAGIHRKRTSFAIMHFVKCMTFSNECGLMQERTVSYCRSFDTEKYVAGPRLVMLNLA